MYNVNKNKSNETTKDDASFHSCYFDTAYSRHMAVKFSSIRALQWH